MMVQRILLAITWLGLGISLVLRPRLFADLNEHLGGTPWSQNRIKYLGAFTFFLGLIAIIVGAFFLISCFRGNV